MSKSTKIIAALGVVAGLGVAALPLSTFADSAGTATGDAEVIVDVTPAIALEIAGNNDVSPYGPVTDINPEGIGVTTSDGTTLTESAIKTSSSKASLTQNATALGNANALDADSNPYGGFMSTLKVTTNDKGGYTLNVKTAETGTDATSLSSAEGNTIPAVASAGTLTAGTAGWGIKTNAAAANSEDISNNKWYAVATTDQSVKIAGTNNDGYSQDETVVLYGIATDKAQPTGTYQNTLTYTATTAN